MQKRFFALSVLMGCAVIGCSRANRVGDFSFNPQAEIVGGEAASESDANIKSIVGLYLDTKFANRPLRQLCTATLIDRDLVLTAAHCVDELISKDATKYLVSFGTRVIKTQEDLKHVVLRRVAKKVVHRDWTPIEFSIPDPTAPLYDIALLKLDEPAPESFASADLPEKSLILSHSENLLTYGYGMTMEPKDPEASQLMTTILHVNNWNYSETHFESLAEPSATCGGDSGGPAFLKNTDGKLVVVGITSFGDSSCRKDSYFTRVSTFLDWIQQSRQGM